VTRLGPQQGVTGYTSKDVTEFHTAIRAALLHLGWPASIEVACVRVSADKLVATVRYQRRKDDPTSEYAIATAFSPGRDAMDATSWARREHAWMVDENRHLLPYTLRHGS
jgi:hypothetical protein